MALSSKNLVAAIAAAALLAAVGYWLLGRTVTEPAVAQASCAQRGELDTIFCDEDGDMTADTPKDAAKLKNPETLLLTYSPQEDSATYEKLWAPYVEHLAQCSARKTKFFPVYSSAATVEAIRSGRVAISLLSAGDMPFAVNLGGATPIAIHGTADGKITAYHLIVVVKNDSPYQTLADLKDKRVAHVSPSSNSGNLAPRALFPAQGLVPDKDYKVIYSGKHDNSIAGVQNNDYDAAAVADDVLERMIQRGLVKPDELRVLFTSEPFPAGGLAVAHDLASPLAQKIRECTFSFRFPPELSTAFRGVDRMVPLDYKRDFSSVRKVAAASGETFNRAAFDARAAREAAAKAAKESAKK